MFFPAADTIAFAEGGAEVMRIDSSGNVGIGTSSPSYNLDVVGNVNGSVTSAVQNSNSGTSGFARFLAIANGGNAQFGMTSTGYTAITNAQDAMLFNANGASGGIVFAQDGVAQAKIDSSGRVGINTASPTAMLHINSDSDSITPARFNVTTTGAASKNCVIFQREGTNVGFITVTNAATAYVTSSDYRLKENIVPMTGALDKVAQLNPVTYKWKIDGSDGQGFIAHELQAIVPDCVYGEKDAVDTEGNPEYQGVDTSFLVATLTAAIQEQQTIINDLKARVEALEAK
jgi:hypothetical protein